MSWPESAARVPSLDGPERAAGITLNGDPVSRSLIPVWQFQLMSADTAKLDCQGLTTYQGCPPGPKNSISVALERFAAFLPERSRLRILRR